MVELDINYIRKQFPVLSSEAGSRVAFFDNAGGSYTARPVIDRLNAFYNEYKVQPYGPNILATKAGEAMDEGRRSVAELLGVSVDCVTIGASSTQNLNTLAQACSGILNENSEVVVSEQDHEANIGGWERICQLTGAAFRLWKVEPDTGELSLERLNSILNEKTKIVCVTHSSNIIGSINPVNDIANITHSCGAYLIIDGVSFAPHRWPDLSSMNADAYVFSTYKTYGTHQGVMFVEPDFLSKLTPQCHFFNEHVPWKILDSSGPDHASIAALSGIASYFNDCYDHHFNNDQLSLKEKTLKFSEISNHHEENLCAHLLESLKNLPIKMYGKSDMSGREANVSFRANNLSSKEVVSRLALYNIASKHGHFYAYRLLKAMNVDNLNDGVVRLSLSHYNTMEEVDRCILALNDILLK